MQCIILAAGEGVRMRPLTNDKPKPMILVAGKPILEHVLNALPDSVNEIILVVGYLQDKIREHFGAEYNGRKITYVTQEVKLGTYHGLKICEPFLRKGERFMMLFADDLHGPGGLRKLAELGQPALLVAESSNPGRFGVVEVHPDQSIRSVEEKPEQPKTNLVSTGAKMLDHRIFDYPAGRHSNGEYYLTDSLAQMLAAGHKIMTVKADFWLAIGYPEDIAKAEKALKR